MDQHCGGHAGHQGGCHDNGGQILVDGFHGEHHPGHGCVESRRQPGSGTAADQGPLFQVGVVQGVPHPLAGHGPNLDRRSFPAHGKAGPDAQGSIQQFHQDHPGPVGAFLQAQHNAPDLGDAAAPGNGSPPDQGRDHHGNQEQGPHPQQGIGGRHILEKIHHLRPVPGHKAQTQPQHRNAQAGGDPHQDSFKSQLQFQVGNMEHPLEGLFPFLPFHLTDP